MSDLSWVFEVVDKSSGPLKNIDDKLKVLPNDLNQVEAALKKVDEAAKLQALSRMPALKQAGVLLRMQEQKLLASKKVEEQVSAASKALRAKSLEHAKAKYDQGRKAQQAAIQKEMAQVKAFKDKVANARAAEKAGNSALMSDLAMMGGGAAAMAAAVAGAALAAGASLIKFGLSAAQAKQAGVGMLKVFEGDRADRAFDVLQRMGIAAGQSADETAMAFQKLRGAGFASKNAQDILAASFDIGGNLGGGEQGKQAADKFREFFTKVNLKGKAEGEDIKGLTEMGVGIDPLAQALGRRLKVDAKTAKSLLQQGAASAVDLQNSVLDVVQSKINGGGALGSKAKAFAAGSVDAQLQSLSDNAKRLFQDVNTRPFVDALSKVNEALAGDTGARIKVLANNFFKLFEVGGKLDIVEGLRVGVDVFEQFYTKLETFGAAFDKGFNTGAIGSFNAEMNRLDAILGIAPQRGSQSFEKLAETMARVATVGVILLRVVETIDLAVSKVLKGIADIATTGGPLARLGEKFGGLGKEASAGLAGGLASGASSLSEATSKLADVIPSTIASKLEIKSPSKVTARLGAHTADGLMSGFEAQAPDFSVGNMIGAAMPTVRDDLTAERMGARAPISIGDINVTVTGAANPKDVGQRVAASVREELLMVLEEMGYA